MDKIVPAGSGAFRHGHNAGQSAKPPLSGVCVGTEQWSALDHALDELIENHDLEERTSREYIVGYLCQALATKEPVLSELEAEEQKRAHMRAVIAKAQAMMLAADPHGRSMADELIEERHREAVLE